MAYTQTDLDSIQAAILALAKGERVVEITIDGETSIWQRVSLPELRSLRDEIAADVAAAQSDAVSAFYPVVDKGL